MKSTNWISSSIFYSLHQKPKEEITFHWPWKLIWKIKLPPKISCFSWSALHGTCLTQDNLTRRKFQMAIRCYMCMKEAETHNHLFLQCRMTANLWSMFLALFGLKWVMPQNIRDVLISWGCWKVDSTIKRIWKMIPASIFWSIWKERSRRCFDGISTTYQSLKANCLMFLYAWVYLSPLDCPDSFLNHVSY